MLDYTYRENKSKEDVIPEIRGEYGGDLKLTETMVQYMKMVKDICGKNSGCQLRHFSVNLSNRRRLNIFRI